ncbi:MAG: hypothetical protein GWP91_02080 [Rhodobacterales bacterium]|nr:hypothetical protein [Rhodobacterales bacterium]
MRFIVTLLVLAMSTAPALADDTENVDVEDVRRQIEQRVARNAWSGADRAYLILKDQGVRLSARDHLLGGLAAQALGDIDSALTRFELTQKQQDDEEIQDRIQKILQAYGQAKLKVPRDWSGGIPLRALSPIVDPTRRLVIDNAKRKLTTDGRFSGLLPRGRYQLGEVAFEVTGDKLAKGKL